MAWFKNVSLGDLDLAGAVNKLSESVKNIEKNFDNALGLEENASRGEGSQGSGIWPSSTDRKTLFKPVMAFMGQTEDDSDADLSGKDESLAKEQSLTQDHGTTTAEESSILAVKEPIPSSVTEGHDTAVAKESSEHAMSEKIFPMAEESSVEAAKESTSPAAEEPSTNVAEVNASMETETEDTEEKEKNNSVNILSDMNADVTKEFEKGDPEADRCHSKMDTDLPMAEISRVENSPPLAQHKEDTKVEDIHELELPNSILTEQTEVDKSSSFDSSNRASAEETHDSQGAEPDHIPEEDSPAHHDPEIDPSDVKSPSTTGSENVANVYDENLSNSISMCQDDADSVNAVITSGSNESIESNDPKKDVDVDDKEKDNSITNVKSDDSRDELEKVRKELKLMEAALQGAARQAQSKADEIARLMNENEQLKSTINDLKGKTSEADIDALKDEYHQRVSSLERKVYALTRERDALRREQNKKSDAALLLKEKDEIISQVMAEGEELSKKQAIQESTIRKLRAQIREFEEEKQKLISKLQAEEAKVDSVIKEKAEIEKLLHETIEKNQAELAAQKEFYTSALNAAKEAESQAEARANTEARAELESRLKEASERESVLVQALEELRQTLTRTEQQAVFREDMLQRDIDELQKRYQASELRYNELVTEVPESTRPLLRQIEAMQETAARRAEAWAGVERSLNSRLQEAEAKAAAAEEKERVMSDRLSQSQSRITVLETQIACLRTEQTQLSRSLEKERQRASESRQEYLAAMEEVATQEGRAKQLEDEIKELRNKHKRVLQEEMAKTELLEKELEKEKAARIELEKTSSRQIPRATSQDQFTKLTSPISENGSMHIRKLSSAGSLGSMEESHFLQASLDSSDSFSSRRGLGDTTMSPYFLKSMTPSAFEAALRQKDGELQSYISRLSTLESIRDSLSEELVKLTEESEKLRAEASHLPSLRAELEALRRRHSSALELMGERDEELEELRNDIADLKEMYREQIDLLVNKVQVLSSSIGAS